MLDLLIKILYNRYKDKYHRSGDNNIMVKQVDTTSVQGYTDTSSVETSPEAKAALVGALDDHAGSLAASGDTLSDADMGKFTITPDQMKGVVELKKTVYPDMDEIQALLDKAIANPKAVAAFKNRIQDLPAAEKDMWEAQYDLVNMMHAKH